MSTFLRYVLFMLVLFTAKSLHKISVNPDRISSINNHNNNNINNINSKSPPTLQQSQHNNHDRRSLDQITKYHHINENKHLPQQQQQQKNYHNNDGEYLLPLHPSMQQQLLLQQEFEQQKKHQDALQNNGFTTPFQSLTSAQFDEDSIVKLGGKQQYHNHGRYTPPYAQKYSSTQLNYKNKNPLLANNLPRPEAQRQATKIEFYGSSSSSTTGTQLNRRSETKAGSDATKYFQQNNFHIPSTNFANSITDLSGTSGISNLPPIPPFPAISAFNFFGGVKGNSPGSGSSSNGGLADSHKSCGGILNARHGIVQTPNFPDKFETPIVCVWIIDASEFATTSTNISIVVYLNQLYVLGVLKFTEYMYYSEDYKVPSHRIFELTEDDVTQVTWIQFQSQYLEIRFEMRSLDGTHLRALNRFLDVYGFNITYEVDQVKSYQCNALKCHFLGHCYATDDFSSYYCSCFKGFKGSDCSRGPLCEQNYCENGGSCKQIGDVAVKCICQKGFKGNKCEIAEISEVSTSCTLSKSAQCHHLCLQNDPVRAMNNGCKCNITKMTALTTNEKHTNRTGKTRFEVTIRLGSNLTALFRSVENADKKSGENHLPTLLEKLMSRALRNFNITKVNDLELISNSSKRLDITFHFFGVKSDSNRIREAITRMVERGRLGNFTLVSNFHLFDENPPLHLQEIILNQKSPIRENTEFILSCVAQGSPKIEFRWYKDGILVNASKATRDIWTVVLPPEQENVYTSVLGVSKANRLDEGSYTCKVIDWGVEQCQSTHVYVQTPPQLIVDPASITVYRGDSLNVRCLSPAHNYNNHRHHGSLGYSWTRNGVLFQSDPKTSMWEDLYPDGSILKIKNIQKSAEYTCVVSNNVSPVSKSVYITVIDKGVIQLCATEKRYNINWQSAAPGAEIIGECPPNFEGYTKRICEQRSVQNSTWLQPDFSNCIPNQLNRLFNEFRALTLGYQKTNCSTILKSCLEYTIRRHTDFYPGEASTLMDLLQEVENYLKIKGTHLEREMAAEIILHILDKVMQNVVSLNSQQQIKKFQLLTQSAALNRETIAASQLATSTSSSSSLSSSSANNGNIAIVSNTGVSSSSSSAVSSPTGISTSSSSSSSTSLLSGSGSISSSSGMSSDIQRKTSTGYKSTSSAGLQHDHDNESIADTELTLERLNSFRIYTTSIKTLPFNLRIYGDDLFSDQLYLDIRATKNLMDIMSNGTVFASVISYKNLTKFLPRTYYARGSDIGPDYMPASRIIATWLFQSNRSNDNYVEPLNIPMESGRVEIIFQHENVPKNTDWQPVCGHEMRTTYESTWRTDLCLTKNLMENMTRCVCPLSGTFVVLLAKKNYGQTSIENRTSTRPIFVIISCGCCFLLSCTAFAILIPILYSRKCSITFLKMQFCTSTSTVMAIYLLGFLKLLPQDWHSIISSTLASLMILGLSTLVAILLVIQSELVPKKFHITAAAAALSASSSTAAAAAAVTTNINNPSSLLTGGGGGGGGGSGGGGLIVNTGGGSNTNGGIRGAIGISWLFPILFAICSPLIYSIIGKWPLFWWLEYHSSGFILFLIVQGLLISLFLLLFVTLLKKLTWLLKKHDKHNGSIWRRIGLLYRTGIISLIRLSTDALFLIYLNTNHQSIIISHLFGVCCIILGFAILFCFVIKAEYNLRTSLMRGGGGGGTGGSNSSCSKDPQGSHLKTTSTKTSLEDNYEYCSGSINSPLNFYSNEKEKDNESGPLPLTIISTARCPLDRLQHHQQQKQQQLQQQQQQTICKNSNTIGGIITVGGSLQTPSKKTSSLITIDGNGISGNNVGLIAGAETIATTISTTTMSTVETYLGNGNTIILSASAAAVAAAAANASATASNVNSSVITTSNINNIKNCIVLDNNNKKNDGICDISLHEMELPSSNNGTLLKTKQQGQQQQYYHHHHHHFDSGDNFNTNNSTSYANDCIRYDNSNKEIVIGSNLYQCYIPNQNSNNQNISTTYLSNGSDGCGIALGAVGSNAATEFVGVETLDILQGVSPDSIIGIRASKILSTTSSSNHYQQQQLQQQYSNQNPKTSSLKKRSIDNNNPTNNTTITTSNSVKTQTPKSQKRVTIVEEPKQLSTSHNSNNISFNSNSLSNNIETSIMQHHHYKIQQQQQQQQHQQNQQQHSPKIIMVTGIGPTSSSSSLTSTDIAANNLITLPPIITITSTSSLDDSSNNSCSNSLNSNIDPGGIQYSNKLIGIGKTISGSTSNAAAIIQQQQQQPQHPSNSITSTNNNNSDNLIIGGSGGGGGGGPVSNINNNAVNNSDTIQDDDDNEDGSMLDRITHDLDYLLNRTTELPNTINNPTIRRLSSGSSSAGSASGSEIIVMIQTNGVSHCPINAVSDISNSTICLDNDNSIPPPPLPPLSLPPVESNIPPVLVTSSSSSSSASTSSALSSTGNIRGNIIHHEVIIEESEQE